jgi:Kef-type K+ transport system membrane component KefB
MHLLDAIGQLGVILLVGLTGLGVDTRLLRRRGRTAAKVSLGGLLTPLALGIGAGFLLPANLIGTSADRLAFALFIGVALGISAIPVAAKILIDMGLLRHPLGQLTLLAAVVDDAVGWLLLSLVSALATTGLHGGDLWVSVAAVPGFILVAVFAVRPVATVLLRRAAAVDDAEHRGVSDGAGADGPGAGDDDEGGGRSYHYLAVITALVLAGSATTDALHLEAIFGAFVVGMAIGSIPDIATPRLAPLRGVVLGVLAPIFFTTAGLRVDLGALTSPSALLAGLVVLTLAISGKLVGAYLGARAGGLGRWEGFALGSALNARGVVELVLAAAGLRLGVLNTASYTIIVLVAVLTSLMTPALLRFAIARVDRVGVSGVLMGAPELLRHHPRQDTPGASPSASGPGSVGFPSALADGGREA